MLGSNADAGAPETGPYVPYPTYFALRLATGLGSAGDAVVAVESDTPDVAAYAVLRSTGRLGVLFVNKSTTADWTVDVAVSGFTASPAGATAERYGRAEDEAQRRSAYGAATTTAVPVGSAATGAGSRFAVRLPASSLTLLDLGAEAVG